MTRKVVGNLILGQAVLYVGLLMCVALKPDGLGANDGISYYGIFRQTVVPYAIAILGPGYFIWTALRSAAPFAPAPVYVRRMANWLAVFSVLVVLTPYSANLVFDWVHTLAGTFLFVLQLVLGLRLLGWSGGDGWTAGLLLAQFVSGVFCAVYVLPKHGFLLQGQVAFQVAFGALLVRTMRLFVPQTIAQTT
ncbi:hypothetical protein [Actinoallomurus iriomotensis]|uniref:Uncharacterized protein n=1 Tax=Actinoallomurus iriomotensis TaxID=478107 RepID=A0A9W6W694_9ACTN|nr:hypothetical protein [Actinoallomurus iriomotensis]GLY77500.1 hypothetical protein Airi01_057670 [Actinoallomurus iriomotensis]GLY91807.1 hypothetical protein Airi02_097350 [Actinoallomurus iriomotensis]